MQPIEFKPTKPDDFIGPARHMARLCAQIIQRSKKTGAPLKMFLRGDPGVGKSALLDCLTAQLGANKFQITKLNGASLKLEFIEDYARSLHYTDIFGGYRVLRIEEVDKANHLVQARMLTLLDDLPRQTAVLCTSNRKVQDLDERFQSRFQVFDIKAPDQTELTKFLRGFKLSSDQARRIATFACGNVRLALFDAQSALDEAATLAA